MVGAYGRSFDLSPVEPLRSTRKSIQASTPCGRGPSRTVPLPAETLACVSSQSRRSCLTRVLADKRELALHVSNIKELRRGRIVTRENPVDTDMVRCISRRDSTIIRTEPKPLAILGLRRNECAGRRVRRVEHSLGPEDNLQRARELANLHTIVLEDIQFASGSSEVVGSIIDRIRKAARLPSSCRHNLILLSSVRLS